MLRLNLLSLAIIVAGGALLSVPQRAGATYYNPIDQPKYCCYEQWPGTAYCCHDTGCRITKEGCVAVT